MWDYCLPATLQLFIRGLMLYSGFKCLNSFQLPRQRTFSKTILPLKHLFKYSIFSSLPPKVLLNLVLIRLQSIFCFFHYLPGLLPENLIHLHLSLQMSSQESVYGWEWTIFLKQMLFMLKVMWNFKVLKLIKTLFKRKTETSNTLTLCTMVRM